MTACNDEAMPVRLHDEEEERERQALASTHDLQFAYGVDVEADGHEAEREANKLLGALGSIRAERDANHRLHKEEVERARRWLDRVDAPLARSERYLMELLEAVTAHMHFYGGKKSRDLPRGTVGWRSKPARLVVEEMALVVEWAREHGVPVRVEETVLVPDITRVWKTGVHVVPGCEVVPAEEVFHATPSEVS